MYAVIKTGGKQYRVAAEDVIEIERTGAAEGDIVEFPVLMVAGDGNVEIGTPVIDGATVAGQVMALSRGPKIIIFKKKRRKHYRRKNGHRQDLMQVQITEILTGGKKPSKKAAAPAGKKAAPAKEDKAKDDAKPAAKKAAPAAKKDDAKAEAKPTAKKAAAKKAPAKKAPAKKAAAKKADTDKK
ncbi:MAG: 50S ribosomal protein L21 [Pseudomonadota bacterium]